MDVLFAPHHPTHPGGAVPVWLGIVAALSGLLVLDFLIGRIFMTRDSNIRIKLVPGTNPNPRRRWIVLKGFSNPLEPFIEGMKTVLDGEPMLVVHYGLCQDENELIRKIFVNLNSLEGPRDIAIYGHSRGGQIGDAFLYNYEVELGCVLNPIRELFLDCAPGDADSLPAPRWVAKLLRGFLKVYRGGPLLALAVAAGNWYSRVVMPAPLDDAADKALYKRYARGLMWYNNRGWCLEMLSMLTRKMPTETRTVSSARPVYIGATDPSKDKLVRQTVAIRQWQQRYPQLLVIRDAAVGHAWPMEQPTAYRRIVRSILDLSDR